MKEYATSLTLALGIGGSLLQGYYDDKATDYTIKRIERGAKLRAQDRHQRLREVLSAQRVELTNQGRTGVTSAMLAAKSVQEAARDTLVEGYETGDRISDLRTQATNAWIGRVGEIAGMGLKYMEGEREKELLKKKGDA